MLELTKEQCIELEKRVREKLKGAFDGPNPDVQEAIAQMAVTAVIATMREYERMIEENPKASS